MQLPEISDSEDQVSLEIQPQGRARFQWLLAASLFCAFALWMYWGVLTVLMLQMGFPHSPSELFSLIAIAGLSGGSLRIAMGLLMPAQISVTFFTLGVTFLILPALGCGFFLKIDTPLWVLQSLALLSGIGGGCSSVFIGAIYDLLPRKEQSTALGVGLGFGHLGAAGTQIFLPLVVTSSLWGVGGKGLVAGSTVSTWLGRMQPGTELWLSSAGFIWFLPISVLILLLWLSLRGVSLGVGAKLRPNCMKLLGRILLAMSVSLSLGALYIWLILPGVTGAALQLSQELIVGLAVFMTLLWLRLLPGSIGRNLDRPYEIFENKHTWLMAVFSAASLGTFLGFSVALPLTLYLVFGFSHVSVNVHEINVNAPGVFIYVWMGPLIGTLMHPIGGWMADRFGGARITQMCMLVLMLASTGIAFFLFRAYRTTTPEQYFLPTLLLFLLLFAAAGAGYSSVTRTAARLFPPAQSLHANIWLSAIAAFGVFYVPSILAEKLDRNVPEQAMIGFGFFYGVCLLLNGWFYLRRNSAFYNP